MSGSVTHNTQKTEFWQYWQIWYWVTHILHTILRITMSVFGSQTKTVQLSRVSELCTRVSFQCQMNHCFWINWLNIWFSDSLHIKTFYLLPPTGGWMNYSMTHNTQMTVVTWRHLHSHSLCHSSCGHRFIANTLF